MTRDLHAGAAKVDITPRDLTALDPMGGGSFTGVHDPLTARVLVVDDGTTEVAIVAVDLIEVGDTVPARARIERECGIPAANVFIAASHSHSAPRFGDVTPGALAHGGGPESAAHTEWVTDRVIDGIRAARAAAVPARLAGGSGHVDVNVNRDEFVDGRWVLGRNELRPSDKTVRVVRFEGIDGAVIGAVANYAVHPVTTIGLGEVSADIAGVAAGYAEELLGDDAVVLWTLGAVGDQNPRVFEDPFRNGRPTAPLPDAHRRAAHAAMQAQGVMIGAEIARVTRLLGNGNGNGKDISTSTSTSTSTSSVDVAVVERVVACPTKRGVDVMDDMHQEAVDTVDLRLTLLRLGDVVLAGIGGEVVEAIARRLRDASPLRQTLVVSLVNDRIGYLPEDAAFALGTFEVNGCPIEVGFAEDAIVDGLTSMIEESRR